MFLAPVAYSDSDQSTNSDDEDEDEDEESESDEGPTYSLPLGRTFRKRRRIPSYHEITDQVITDYLFGISQKYRPNNNEAKQDMI